MLAQFLRIFTPSADTLAMHALYQHLVEQARRPVFYVECEVPDTLDGRFELILLHLFLVLSRLKAEGRDTYNEERQLIEVFMEDMDRSIRELGVGDTGVSRRVKKMANAFYGRMKAYTDATGLEAMEEALKRNLYGTVEPSAGTLQRMVGYYEAAQNVLKGTPLDDVLSASFSLPEPK